MNYHSLFFALGGVTALLVYGRLAPTDGRRSEQVAWDIFWALFWGLVGARVSWALTNHARGVELIAFWHVGLVSWGGFLGGGLAAWFRLVRRPERGKWAVALWAAVLSAWAVGRVGNFLQHDAYGVLVRWAPGWLYGRMPIQLIESGLCLAVVGRLLVLRRRGERAGRILAETVLWYGAGRVILDHWRDLPALWGGLNSSQLVALGVALCAIMALLWQNNPRP